MAAAADGDARALDALCARHRDDLHRYLRSTLRDAEDAQDALQATLMKAVAALRTTRPHDLRAWLFTIAHHEAISIIRRRRPEVQLDDGHGGHVPGVDEVVAGRAELAALLGDLAGLPERQRSALLLREVAGLDHRAVAAALGVSEMSSRNAVYEAKRALRRCAAARGERTSLRALLAPLSLLGGGGGAVATKTAAVVATVVVAAGAVTMDARRAAPVEPQRAPVAAIDAPAARVAPASERALPAAAPANRPVRMVRTRRTVPATTSSPPVTRAAAPAAAPAPSQPAPRPASRPAAAPSPAPPPEDEPLVSTPQQGPVPQTSAEASDDGATVCLGPCDEPGLPLP